MANFFTDSTINKKWKQLFGLTILISILCRWILKKYVFNNQLNIWEDVINLVIALIGLIIIWRLLWIYRNNPEKLR